MGAGETKESETIVKESDATVEREEYRIQGHGLLGRVKQLVPEGNGLPRPGSEPTVEDGWVVVEGM